MPAGVRQLVVLLLAVAQVFVGASAGGVVCVGGPPAPGRDGHAACSHAGAEGRGLPGPAQPHEPSSPHDGHDQCPCIDLAVPFGRADDGDAGVSLAQHIVLPPAGSHQVMACARPAIRRADPRPPGPAPGLPTVRLLI